MLKLPGPERRSEEPPVITIVRMSEFRIMPQDMKSGHVEVSNYPITVYKEEECEESVLAEMLFIHEAPLSPRRELRSLSGGSGTRELVGAVGAIELAVAHEVRLDALGHALQTPGNFNVLFCHLRMNLNCEVRVEIGIGNIFHMENGESN